MTTNIVYLVSPAKTLDYEHPAATERHTSPAFLDQSETLIKRLRELSSSDIQKLMGVSEKIADLNVKRNHEWQRPFTLQNAKQAAFAFKGDVYTGLNIETVGEPELEYIQQHLLILSGLYGVLRPLDLMQPYRLEMGTKLEVGESTNLYAFWGNMLADTINERAGDQAVIVNLASNEYFKAAKKKRLQARLITPQFRDLKNGQYKMISFYAKKARGLMMRFAADHKVSDVEALKEFNYEGYAYNASLSSEDDWVFTRDEAPK